MGGEKPRSHDAIATVIFLITAYGITLNGSVISLVLVGPNSSKNKSPSQIIPYEEVLTNGQFFAAITKEL